MAKSEKEKLASIAKRKASMQKTLRELNRQEKMLKLEADLEKYKEIAPIAEAAIDVFGDKLPRDREQARARFIELRNIAIEHGNNHSEQQNTAQQ